MKMPVITLFFASISLIAFSQQPALKKLKNDIIMLPDGRFVLNMVALGKPAKPDTFNQKIRERSNNDQLPYNGIPNAIIQKLHPDKYLSNNGKGQDIYQSQLDFMPILKPDNSFSSGMPVKSFGAFLFPSRFRRLRGGDYSLLIDSLSHKPVMPYK